MERVQFINFSEGETAVRFQYCWPVRFQYCWISKSLVDSPKSRTRRESDL